MFMLDTCIIIVEFFYYLTQVASSPIIILDDIILLFLSFQTKMNYKLHTLTFDTSGNK